MVHCLIDKPMDLVICFRKSWINLKNNKLLSWINNGNRIFKLTSLQDLIEGIDKALGNT